MRKIIILFLCTISVYSQVGIGTVSPKAALDIVSSENGLLIPRIALTSNNLVLPVLNPNGGVLEVGTMIWNTNTAGVYPNNVVPGYYFWTGSIWKKIDNNTKSGTVASTTTLVEPNVSILAPLGALTSVGTNSLAQVFDNTTIAKTINVTGLVGNIGAITVNVRFSQTLGGDADFYLESPSGQIIELCTDNGGSIATNFNVTFSDAGATNITSWAGGNVTGTYRPEGTLTSDVVVPNITTMSGFHGFSPNGTWTLRLRDDSTGDSFSFTSFDISIATYGSVNYRLVGETEITYSAGDNIIANAMYSANSSDDQGFITALTRTTTSAGAIGTIATSLPGTLISYASDSPKQGAGNFWATTYNQAVSTGLVDSTTYYFQIWSKGNIEVPIGSNEIFSLIPLLVPR